MPDTNQLSSGERHLIARMRLARTQPEQARKLRISLWQYRRAEKDVAALPATPWIEDALSEPLAEHEELLLRRVRANITRRSLAKRLKVSEFWLYRMEHGTAPCDRLREFWAKR